MILMDMKKETSSSSSSPLNLSTPSSEPSISFSELLRGVSQNKDGKTIQNGSLILDLKADEKSSKDVKSTSKLDSLLSLLKNEENLPVQTKEEPLELNPKLMATMTTKEIKTLVADAKNYLKDKIKESDDYKNFLVKDLPKTLKGLVKVAKIFGIEISKISVEEVKAHSELKPARELIKQEDVKTITLKSDDKKVLPQDVKEVAKDKATVSTGLREILANKKVPAKEVKTEVVKVAAQKEVHTEKKIAQAEAKELKADKVDVSTQTKEVNIEKKTALPEVKELHTDKAATKKTKVQTQQVEDNDRNFIDKNPSVNLGEKVKEIKATPLFKAQSTVEHIPTEQIVQVKSAGMPRVESKTPKEKADETLMLLLRGEKPSMTNPALTADFSVATAKVIAPSATSEMTKSLEKLLSGDASSSQESSLSAKTEALSTNKADSFEVKLNEAKQMIKYLSQDVKTAIEDYKSPFTRVKVQLNPQKLGEVDVTIVQRGKNLHVNISSNNTAVNTLAMNANELRVQLNNSGINNATLNFNNSSQQGDSGASNQQQNRQNEQKAHDEYSYFEAEEANEEILSSLEIIVPQYV